jgi:hypothetical protein
MKKLVVFFLTTEAMEVHPLEEQGMTTGKFLARIVLLFLLREFLRKNITDAPPGIITRGGWPFHARSPSPNTFLIVDPSICRW